MIKLHQLCLEFLHPTVLLLHKSNRITLPHRSQSGFTNRSQARGTAQGSKCVHWWRIEDAVNMVTWLLTLTDRLVLLEDPDWNTSWASYQWRRWGWWSSATSGPEPPGLTPDWPSPWQRLSCHCGWSDGFPHERLKNIILLQLWVGQWWIDAAVADGSPTIVWEETPCHGGSVRYPGSGVDRTNWLAFGDVL